MPRLDRGIQYAAAFRLTRNRLGVLDRPPSRAMTVVRGESACSTPLVRFHAT